MAIILYRVDVRSSASLHEKLIEQQSERAAFGEQSFEFYVDDNARNIGYVFLRWESRRSARRFLESSESSKLIQQWPIEGVIDSIALSNVGKMLEEINFDQNKA